MTRHEILKSCFYHAGCGCATSKKSKIALNREEHDKKVEAVCKKYGKYIKITECCWRKNTTPYKNYTSKFLARSSDITEEEIMDAIMNDEFFGLVQCDISSPESVIRHFSQLNFPPIFRKVQLSEDMIQTKLINDADDLKIQIKSKIKLFTGNCNQLE